MSISPRCRCGPENGEGKLRGSLPKVNSTTFSRTMPMATVDISQAFDPARTNGRTTNRSTRTPQSAQSASDAAMPGTSPHCSCCEKTKTSTAPSITDVPWEKLTVEETVYVM